MAPPVPFGPGGAASSLPTSPREGRRLRGRRIAPSAPRHSARRHREQPVTGITVTSPRARFAPVSVFHPLPQNGQSGQSTGNPRPASLA